MNKRRTGMFCRENIVDMLATIVIITMMVSVGGVFA